MQLLVGAYFLPFFRSHRLSALVETRLLVDTPTGARTGRHRIPDVMVLQLPFQMGRVIHDVPVVAVEIKSPGDTLDDIVERCMDYQELGILNILIMDPDKRRMYTFSDRALHMELSPIVLTIPGHPDILFDPSTIYHEMSERTEQP